jgi:hypothetical protein
MTDDLRERIASERWWLELLYQLFGSTVLMYFVERLH